MNTIDVYGRYVVGLKADLTITDEAGFMLGQVNPIHPPVLINRGSVTVTGDLDSGGVVGATTDFSVYKAVFWNRAGASFQVISTGPHDYASGVSLRAEINRVINDGELIVSSAGDGSGGGAEGVDGDSLALVNSGHIRVESGGGAGAFSGGPGSSLLNTGLMETFGGTSATGVSLGSGHFTNQGTITVHSADSQATGVAFNYAGYFGAISFDNSGSLIVSQGSGESAGVFFDTFVTPDAHLVFHNSGLIQADVAFQESSYNSAHAATTIDNSGQIIGDIDLRLDDDTVLNTGTITGDVRLGDGDDRYHGGHGTLIGQVEGGAGDDHIVGGFGDDILFGEESSTFYDLNGDDTLAGGRGNDRLVGGAGEDSLIGGIGKDVLNGGGGADVLAGGFGRDTFIFESAGQSAVGYADLITDLADVDVIDLSGIDADVTQPKNQAFTLVAALDGHPGQAALSYDAGSNLTNLSLDVDGDGVADAIVTMAGDHSGFVHFVL